MSPTGGFVHVKGNPCGCEVCNPPLDYAALVHEVAEVLGARAHEWPPPMWRSEARAILERLRALGVPIPLEET